MLNIHLSLPMISTPCSKILFRFCLMRIDLHLVRIGNRSLYYPSKREIMANVSVVDTMVWFFHIQNWYKLTTILVFHIDIEVVLVRKLLISFRFRVCCSMGLKNSDSGPTNGQIKRMKFSVKMVSKYVEIIFLRYQNLKYLALVKIKQLIYVTIV